MKVAWPAIAEEWASAGGRRAGGSLSLIANAAVFPTRTPPVESTTC